MTVIAWDGRYLVTDMRASIGDVGYPVHKIRKLPNVVFAYSGYSDDFEGMINHYWDRTLPNPSNKDQFSRLVIVKQVDGVPELTYMEIGSTEIKPVSKYFASGTGMDFALTAMHLGKTAIDAVHITNKLSSSCGLGISIYDSLENTITHTLYE